MGQREFKGISMKLKDNAVYKNRTISVGKNSEGGWVVLIERQTLEGDENLPKPEIKDGITKTKIELTEEAIAAIVKGYTFLYDLSYDEIELPGDQPTSE